MTTLSSLQEYGIGFQLKVLGALLTDKEFLINVSDSLNEEYFENSSYRWIVNKLLKYFFEFNTNPTLETLSIEIKKVENEILRLSLIETLREAYNSSTSKDLEYIQSEFLNFCRNQTMKKAIIDSVELLNKADFEGIRNIINNALKAGEDKNIGHDYHKDIETRYREDTRNPLPFPWKVFNDMTQGGMGGGDLVLVFGNPGGGKSWVVTCIGAYIASLGYNVLHYTLELSESYVAKRYDSIFTQIPVHALKDNRKKIEKLTQSIKGRIVIKEYPPKKASFGTLKNHIRHLKMHEDFEPHFIIIDYLDYIKTRNRKEKKDEVDDAYIEAKSLAKEMNIPILSPSQANRTGAGKKIIEGDNAAGSYDKIMIGDIVLSLARNRKDKIKGTGIFHWIKNRYGTDGLSFISKIDTDRGNIEINEHPLDLDEKEEVKFIPKSSGNISDDDRNILREKFLTLK